MAPRPEYLKKITVATVGWTPKLCDNIVEERPKARTPIVRVYGTVKQAETGTSNFGPYIKFKGEFEAVNLSSQEKYRAKNLLLPPIGEMAIADALQEAQAENKDASITFGMDIAVEENPSKKGGWNFRYAIIPLRSPEFKGESDALSLLGKALGELPLLEGPKTKGKK
jgi:hypothetical protein